MGQTLSGKRIGATSLVILVTLALLAGIAGFASAAGRDGATIPPIAPGEKAEYAYTGPNSEGTLVISHLGWGLEQDATGAYLPALLLHEELDLGTMEVGDREVPIVFPSTYAFDASGDPILARESAGMGAGMTGSTSPGLLGPGEQTTDTSVHTSYQVVFGASNELCGVSMSPKARDLDARESFGGRCEGESFRRAGGDDGLVKYEGDAGTTVTFEPGRAFPVEVVSGEQSWRLTGQAQTEPAPMPIVPPAPEVPAIGQAKFGRLGPAGPAILDFSLADALEAARNDPDNPEIQEYLDAHPGWFLSQAHSSVDMSGTHPGWDFTLDSDGSPLVVFVFYDGADGSASPVPVPLPAPPVPLPVGSPFEPRYPYFVGAHELTFNDLPDIPRPATVPDPVDVFEAWSAYSSGSGPALWGFSLACDDEEDCQTLIPTVMAGNNSASSAVISTGDEPATEDKDWTTSELIVDATGAIVGRNEQDIVTRHNEGASFSAITRADNPPEDTKFAWVAPTAPASAGVTIASLLAGLAYLLWPVVKGGAVGLFSRVKDDELLDHPVRRQVMQRIEAQPGIHYQELLRGVGIGKGAMDHHLRKMVTAGLTIRRDGGGYACYFPANTGRIQLATAGALKSDGARRILAAVKASPGCDAGAVALAAGVDPSTVTHHVKRLQEAGLVEARKAGRNVYLHPSGVASAA